VIVSHRQGRHCFGDKRVLSNGGKWVAKYVPTFQGHREESGEVLSVGHWQAERGNLLKILRRSTVLINGVWDDGVCDVFVLMGLQGVPLDNDQDLHC